MTERFTQQLEKVQDLEGLAYALTIISWGRCGVSFNDRKLQKLEDAVYKKWCLVMLGCENCPDQEHVMPILFDEPVVSPCKHMLALLKLQCFPKTSGHDHKANWAHARYQVQV